MTSNKDILDSRIKLVDLILEGATALDRAGLYARAVQAGSTQKILTAQEQLSLKEIITRLRELVLDMAENTGETSDD